MRLLLPSLAPLGAGLALFLGAFSAPGTPVAPAASPAREAPAPADLASGPDLAKRVKSCKKCHEDVHGEWSGSRHAKSWDNPEFQAAIAGLEDGGDSCARCHAPRSILETGLGKLPKARAEAREVGVNCFTCHIVGNRYHGPYASKGHGGIKADPRFKQAVLCNSCHGQPEARAEHDQGTTWLASPEEGRRSCQACHMPEKTRKLVSNPKLPDRFLIGEQPCGVHGFKGAREGRGVGEAAALAFERGEGEEKGVALRIEARTGHCLPASSGRAVVLKVRHLNDAGEEVHAFERRWTFPEGPYLRSGEATRVAVPSRGGTAKLVARLEHHILAVPGRPEGSTHLIAEATIEP